MSWLPKRFDLYRRGLAVVSNSDFNSCPRHDRAPYLAVLALT
jgi:hypothetical protein